jgi:hypothetical protein
MKNNLPVSINVRRAARSGQHKEKPISDCICLQIIGFEDHFSNRMLTSIQMNNVLKLELV